MIEKFKNEDFLQQFFLTQDTIMDYFYTSPFFDTSSNNTILRNQPRINLKEMPGKYYELYYASPENTLFIILEKHNKVERLKEDRLKTTVTNGFYILNNEISMCPTNFELFETSIINYIEEIETEMMDFVKNREISFFNTPSIKNEEEKNEDFIEQFLDSKGFLFKKD